MTSAMENRSTAATRTKLGIVQVMRGEQIAGKCLLSLECEILRYLAPARDAEEAAAPKTARKIIEFWDGPPSLDVELAIGRVYLAQIGAGLNGAVVVGEAIELPRINIEAVIRRELIGMEAVEVLRSIPEPADRARRFAALAEGSDPVSLVLTLEGVRILGPETNGNVWEDVVRGLLSLLSREDAPDYVKKRIISLLFTIPFSNTAARCNVRVDATRIIVRSIQESAGQDRSKVDLDAVVPLIEGFTFGLRSLSQRQARELLSTGFMDSLRLLEVAIDGPASGDVRRAREAAQQILAGRE